MQPYIRNIVFGCPDPRALGSFYAELLGMRIIREDWLVIAKDESSFPRLAFGDGPSEYRPPRWPDPEHPQQLRRRKQDSEHWVLIARDDGSLPMLAFQHAQVTAPRWPDPAYPQQLHLDLHFDDSAAAQELALRLGAIRLPPQGGSCPVFADPAAHPFCLCAPGQ